LVTPVPDFGNPRAVDEIPEALRVALGEGAARTPNSAIADSLQDSAPDLANLIRANDLNNAAKYGPQGNLDFRNPAGAQNLVDTFSRSGRTTPAGTNIGGRMFTDASFASPRNIETARLANMARNGLPQHSRNNGKSFSHDSSKDPCFSNACLCRRQRRYAELVRTSW
jgi:hypothetical protein